MPKWTKIITNNFGLKLLAIAFALVLWLIVVNVEDPENTRVFSIPVTIENEEYLTDMGKTYEVQNDSDVISFTVTGKRSVVEELSESDFTAVANLQNIDESFTTVPITITSSRYKNQIEITKRNSYLSVLVENLLSADYEIEVKTEGTLATDCYITSTKVSPEKISVSGPESVMNQIAEARVYVDVSGADESIITNTDIVLADADGNEVSQDRLTLNRTSVDVDVNIRMEKDVELEFETSGTVADGYRFNSITSDVSTVRVVGDAAVLGSLRQIKIESSVFDLTDREASFSEDISLTKYLPDGVSLADGEPETVTVKVDIEGLDTKTFEMPVSNITVENLSGNLNLQFAVSSATVTLSGFQDDLENIKASDLSAVIDATDITKNSTSATAVLNGDYNVVSTITVAIRVTDSSEDAEQSEKSLNQSTDESETE